jgi:hypothetical protein
VFAALTIAVVVVSYSLRVGPRTPRQWLYVALLIAFLTWMLPLMTSLRSR